MTKVNNFEELIEKSFASLLQGKTKYIFFLKGFNYWIKNFDLNFLLESNPAGSNEEISVEKIVSKLSGNDKSYFAWYEDIILLQENKLEGILNSLQYKCIIIENDFFLRYYPYFKGQYEDVYTKVESFSENIYQTYYNEFQNINNQSYISYGGVKDFKCRYTKFSDLISQNEFELVLNDASIEISSELEIVVSDNILKVLNILPQRIFLSRELKKNKVNFELLRKLGINIDIMDELEDSDQISRNKEYEKILKRKNKNYEFKNIPIYENPLENNILKSVNQSVIINELVQNSENAQASTTFKDVFVTAPTGAGKSVMFQIPAIYLAENLNLVTLIITPLIGLMNDQVANIESMTDSAVTINSDYTPIEKQETLEKIKSGEKSILYLSPETLLSNSDLTNLIGDRKIGLLVVDEAHIVATWGKSFRPDYWYLGDFINRLRNGKKSSQHFPIATFTATATFGGDEDMYEDIVGSLKMNPTRFLGNVKRDDIHFDIRLKEKQLAYREEKLETVVNTVNESINNNIKTLTYTPYTRQIQEIIEKVSDRTKVSGYHGKVNPSEKNESLKKFKSGELEAIIATKAFGMGIDIDDIQQVYHFAPTGNIADYVQEIGRAARNPEMIGIASMDFYKEDFRYIKQLFGMSSIKNFQIVGVLRNINELFKKNKTRNFLVSPEDFSYIFPEETIENMDTKLKTTVLMIQKDFEMDPRNGFVPLIFKPRSMFTEGYVCINDDFLDNIKLFGAEKYFSKISLPRKVDKIDKSGKIYTSEFTGDTYKLNYKLLWEEKYKDMSFGAFKRAFQMNELKDNYSVGTKILNRVIIEIDGGENNFKLIKSKFNYVLDSLITIFDELKQANKHFSVDELKKKIVEKGFLDQNHQAEPLAASIIHLLNRVSVQQLSGRRFTDFNSQTNKFSIKNSTYEKRINELKKHCRPMLGIDAHTKTIIYTSTLKDSMEILVGQILKVLELAEVKISGGNKPEYFVRVNSPYAIERIINDENYHSEMLKIVYARHQKSIELMEKFFTELNSDEERWEFIEKYFLGQI